MDATILRPIDTSADEMKTLTDLFIRDKADARALKRVTENNFHHYIRPDISHRFQQLKLIN